MLVGCTFTTQHKDTVELQDALQVVVVAHDDGTRITAVRVLSKDEVPGSTPGCIHTCD